MYISRYRDPARHQLPGGAHILFAGVFAAAYRAVWLLLRDKPGEQGMLMAALTLLLLLAWAAYEIA